MIYLHRNTPISPFSSCSMSVCDYLIKQSLIYGLLHLFSRQWVDFASRVSEQSTCETARRLPFSLNKNIFFYFSVYITNYFNVRMHLSTVYVELLMDYTCAVYFNGSNPTEPKSTF